jgi:hypothetical protein
MATAAHRAAVQTALLSVRGLRRRRLGHVSPTDYPQNGLDKWGRKRLDNNNIGNHPSNYYNYNGAIHPSVTNKSSLSPPPPLLNNGGGSRRPVVVPRATLVLGGEKSIISKSRRNGLNSSSSSSGSGGLENGLSTTTSTIETIGEGDIIDNGVQQVEERRQHSHPSLTAPAKTTSSYDDSTTTATVTVAPPSNNTNDTSHHAVGAERSNNIHTSVSSNRKSSSNSSSTTTTTTQRRQKYSSDLIVILDMDECLIHSQFLSDRCVDKYRQVEDRPTNNKSYPTSTTTTSQPQQQQRQYGGVRGNGQDEEEADSLLFTNAGCDSFRIHLPDGDLVNVNKRPNLDIFLNEITRKFETYIFTAAVEVSC